MNPTILMLFLTTSSVLHFNYWLPIIKFGNQSFSKWFSYRTFTGICLGVSDKILSVTRQWVEGSWWHLELSVLLWVIYLFLVKTIKIHSMVRVCHCRSKLFISIFYINWIKHCQDKYIQVTQFSDRNSNQKHSTKVFFQWIRFKNKFGQNLLRGISFHFLKTFRQSWMKYCETNMPVPLLPLVSMLRV